MKPGDPAGWRARGYRRSGPPLGASLRDDSRVTPVEVATNTRESVTRHRYSHVNKHCCEDRLSPGCDPWSE